MLLRGNLPRQDRCCFFAVETRQSLRAMDAQGQPRMSVDPRLSMSLRTKELATLYQPRYNMVRLKVGHGPSAH